MPIFKADPEKKLQRDLEAARASRAQLIERRTAAEAKLLEQKEAAKKLAHDGADDVALDRIEDAARASKTRLVTLSAALADREAQIATFEKDLAAGIDKRTRAETASELEKRRERFLSVHTALDQVFAEFVEATAAVAEVCVDAQGLLIFSKSARDELRPAVALVEKEVAARAAATISGTESPKLPQAPPALVPPPPLPAAASYLSLQNVKFVDVRGQQQRRSRFMVVELTELQAANALRGNLVCKLDDPRVPQLRKQVATQQPPEAWHCFDLDSNTPPTNDPELLVHHGPGGHARFTPLDRGPAYVVKAPPPAPAVAARNEDSEHD